MAFVLAIPAILSFLTLAAHFLRQNSYPLAALSLLFPLLLLFRRRGSIRILQFLLVIAAVEFFATIPGSMERAYHPNVARNILLGVVAFNLLSAGLLNTPRVLRAYPRPPVGA